MPRACWISSLDTPAATMGHTCASAETMKSTTTGRSLMALAWAIAECYIRFPDQTLPYLSQPHFHPWVHNKAIQKICESYRISPSTKAMLRALKI